MVNLGSYLDNENFAWRILLFICCAVVIIMQCDNALASTSNVDVVGMALCRLVSNLSGGIARGIATLAIFSAGIGVFTGKMKWEIAASIAAGVGIIFAAPNLVIWLSGDTSNTSCAVS